MKKLFLSLLFMMLSVASFSQVFVKKYTSVISEKAGVLGEWENASVTVVFNEKETGNIVFYYTDGATKRLHQTVDVTKDKTVSGETYQIIMCVDDKDGSEVALQLFDDDTALRVIFGKGYYVEFHR